MDVVDFVARYPRLYHLAHGDAWPGLQRHGLLSASALVRLFEVRDADSLLAQRRPRSEPLTHPEHGTAILRDQKPLNEVKLASALTGGMTVREWLEQLNKLAFFFPGREGRYPEGLEKMLEVYDDEPVVISPSTRAAWSATTSGPSSSRTSIPAPPSMRQLPEVATRSSASAASTTLSTR